MEIYKVECDECGSIHTEVYPDGLEGDESYSHPMDPKTCDCPEPQYTLLDLIATIEDVPLDVCICGTQIDPEHEVCFAEHHDD